ncbi:MAG: 3-deoxy-D-manno-octulosonic acid transferase, partial [Lentisphaeria bacterium]
IGKKISQLGMSYSLYREKEDKKSDIILVNVTGELLSLISVSDFVFVGKSLCGNEGGHNIIEPAVFGKPVLHGPEMQNFRDVAEIFSKERASVILTEANFEQEIEKLILDVDYRKQLGIASREVVEKYSGAMKKSLEIIMGK